MENQYTVVLNGTHRLSLSPGDTITFKQLGDVYSGPGWEHIVTKLGTFKLDKIENGAAHFTMVFKE